MTPETRKEAEKHHREHEEILKFLGEFEGALSQAASRSLEQRRHALEKLRELEPRLAEIRDHSADEEEDFEAIFKHHVDPTTVDVLTQEHELLNDLSVDFSTELEVLLRPPVCDELVARGRELSQRIAAHIAHEEALLRQALSQTEK